MRLRIIAKWLITVIVLLVMHYSANAANTIVSDTSDFYSDDFVRNDDHVYQKYIQSVELSRIGLDLADPVITLKTSEQFRVGFDDLRGSFMQYFTRFSTVRQTGRSRKSGQTSIWKEWKRTRLKKFESSFNTRTAYTHYEFVFPNERFIIKKSGNYILRVFWRDQKGNEINAFTRRFMVVDPKITISANIGRAGTSEDYETRQEVDFTLNTVGLRINSPYQDVKVVILQNWRWDNALTTLKPYMVRNEILDYSFDNGTNLFDGANEFRRFDLKSIKFISEKVREITFDDTVFYAKLWDSEKRIYKEYIIEDDINGKFLLKTDDEPSVTNYGEYAVVKFFLPYEAPIVEGNLYVAGGFNCWQYTPENKMQYNYRRKGYEANILFKQGYYNYLYVLLPNNSKTGDATWVEGNHSETRNTYTILVYHRSRGEMYDELVAVGNFEKK